MKKKSRGRLVTMARGGVFIKVFLTVTAFQVRATIGSHQLSSVEKRHHELGSQRNELFEEMQKLLESQQQEMDGCRAALASLQGKEGWYETDVGAAGPLEGEPGVCVEPEETGGRGGHPDPRKAAGAGTIPTLRAEASDAEQEVDFANYFYSYSELDHQRQMLEDQRRMHAYRSAMVNNRGAFEGKTVLDVGSGSGVLAIFAAQAGARKVYAVEYTNMADHARTLVEGNGLSNVIEVIRGSAESILLPEKVDVIVSEWMGYFLLRESMLDSVVVARDKWLKPDGIMFPSHARMVMALVDDQEEKDARGDELESSLVGWQDLVEEAKVHYGIDMKPLTPAYAKECEEYYSLNSAWRDLKPEQVLSPPAVIKEMDLHTCTLEDTAGVQTTKLEWQVLHPHKQGNAVAGWFDVSFRGRDEAPLGFPVNLSTSPDAGYTHWDGPPNSPQPQRTIMCVLQVFYLTSPVPAATEGKPLRVQGSITMTRQVPNPRLYDIRLDLMATDLEETEDRPVISNVYKLS
ncbi:unnamed protein product [Discosporangium mesarthrocarpum]